MIEATNLIEYAQIRINMQNMHAYFRACFVWNMHLCADMHVYLHN